jgi:hypothetical protein
MRKLSKMIVRMKRQNTGKEIHLGIKLPGCACMYKNRVPPAHSTYRKLMQSRRSTVFVSSFIMSHAPFSDEAG